MQLPATSPSLVWSKQSPHQPILRHTPISALPLTSTQNKTINIRHYEICDLNH